MKTLVLATVLGLIGCGDRKSVGSRSNDLFPNFQTIGSRVVPMVSVSQPLMSSDDDRFATMALIYDGDSSEFASDRSFIADVLGNDLNGVNTQIIVQLSQLQSQIEELNRNYTSEDGLPSNCTETLAAAPVNTSTRDLKLPFFKDATEKVFWATSTNIASVPTVTCYVGGSEDGINLGRVFGKQAITSPPTGCTDAFTYWVGSGYSSLNAVNSEDVVNRGATVNRYQVQGLYYNGCSQDIGIAMALTTIYPLAIPSVNEFSGRFELFGNAATSVFQLRTLKFDQNSGSAGFHSIRAAGKAQGFGNLILEFSKYNCNNAACAAPTVSQTTRQYCLRLGSTEGSVSVDSTVLNCQPHEASLADTSLTTFDSGTSTVLSRSVVDFTGLSVFGL
jgi:hypothetical protein